MKVRSRALQFFIRMFARDLVQILYQGILAREADAGGLTAHTMNLKRFSDLAGLAREISHCEEYWRKTHIAKSSDLAQLLYKSLLGRNPQPYEVRSAVERIASIGDLGLLADEMTRSDEHLQRVFLGREPKIVNAIHRGFFGRNAEPAALVNYAKGVVGLESLTAIVRSIRESDTSTDATRIRKWPNPSQSYAREAIVFLHLQKTAGSSVWNMLRDVFGERALFRGYGQGIWNISPGQLATYSVFTGHFDFDSLAYIPRKKLSVFTFLREPKARLISLYRYWRSVTLDPNSYIGVRHAHELDIQPFFDLKDLRYTSDLWNHMTWGVMGQRIWKEWQRKVLAFGLNGIPPEVLTQMRMAIRERMREFAFVGVQDDFDRSIDLLFRVLRRPRPENIRTENMRRTDPKRELLERGTEEMLEELVLLDNIVYEEGRLMYEMYLKTIRSNPDIQQSLTK